MKEEGLQRLNKNLLEILGPDSGFFGRVYTWGQRPTEYEYVGYVLSEDLLPLLRQMSLQNRKTLSTIIIYFDIHMRPLKRLLNRENEEQLYILYSDMAWSHFATVVMFGMLEIAVKGGRGPQLRSKGARIRDFLEDNLSTDMKASVARRYKVDELFKTAEALTDFGSVVEHMWEEVRGGFVHDAGVQYRGMEWTTLNGLGSKEDPIRVGSDVPMQEWLQLTWQAILNSFGYKGKVELPRHQATLKKS